ncbi:MAG TPA: BatD family protein [Thermoanaerobaculia bacterium]
MRQSFLLSAFCFLIFVPARANDMTVDRHALRVGETVTITVSLEDAFASLDDVDVPVRNLAINATPSVSSEFSWINGTVVRRKVFRFAARAIGAGPAQVGPLVITLPDGERESFPAIALQVLPDRAAESNDAAIVLRELLATGRDPFFVIAEADKTQAALGEEVMVTWWLYNATSVQEWQIGGVPKLAEFWVEEVDVRTAQPTQAFVGDIVMQKMPIRRVALFPLRAGTLPIGSMEVEAAVMRRSSGGPFGLFEGNVVDISYSSAPLSLAVHPLPAAAAGAVIGDLTLNCSKPRQGKGGPVVIDASLTGHGNVRAAAAPHFERAPAADVQLVERGTSLDRSANAPSMTRRWQYVLFPASSGAMLIPPLTIATFSPGTSQLRVLRCEASTLDVTGSARPAESSARRSTARARSSQTRNLALIVLAAAAALLLAAIALRTVRRRRGESLRVRELVDDRSPAQIRDVVHERLAARGIDAATLLRESSDRGDAYRALRSLLDALEHDRMTAGEREVERRVRELLDSLQSAA